LHALALDIRKMHNAGLASPDLFTRHIFVDDTPDTPTFCFIDMARLDRRHTLPSSLCARDLAALNVTAPLRHASLRERLRFLKHYSGQDTRTLLPLIRVRVNHLLRRRKFRDFSLPDGRKKTTTELKTPSQAATPEIEAPQAQSTEMTQMP
jgi:hypothetical protein